MPAPVPVPSAPSRVPLLRVLGFLALGLLVHGVLFAAYTRVAREHKAWRSDAAFVLHAPSPRVALLVCGDSHPRTAIDPDLLGPGAFNIAIGGEHYLKTWYRLRALLDKGERRVDAILLPLDAGSFSSWHGSNFAPEYVWGRYVDFLEVGRVRGEPWGYVGRALKAKVFPYAGELRTINQLRTKRFGFGEDLPYGQFSAMSIPDRRATAAQQAKEHFQGAELVDPGLVWAFRQILGWAGENGVRVVLVGFPVTRWYDKWVERFGARARVQHEIVEPLLAQGGDVVYLDHHDLFADRDDLFSDPHHLNVPGRVAFSRLLARELTERGVSLGGAAP